MRVAVYFTPDDQHGLSAAAAKWLGWDPHSASLIERDVADDRAAVSKPAHYGFHATIKAPFHLAPMQTLDALQSALTDYCGDAGPFELPALEVRKIKDFFALVPQGDLKHLTLLANETVRFFEHFRADITPQDIAKRQPQFLTERQNHYLKEFGYPYIFEFYRFHMTLSGSVALEHQNIVEESIYKHFDKFIGRPLAFDALSLFVEPSPQQPFYCHSRHMLGKKTKSEFL